MMEIVIWSKINEDCRKENETWEDWAILIEAQVIWLKHFEKARENLADG